MINTNNWHDINKYRPHVGDTIIVKLKYIDKLYKCEVVSNIFYDPLIGNDSLRLKFSESEYHEMYEIECWKFLL